jgi:hypothetical protein
MFIDEDFSPSAVTDRSLQDRKIIDSFASNLYLEVSSQLST